MSGPLPFTGLIQTLPSAVPFVGPEALERQHGRAINLRLGANESAFGISPLARRAMERALQNVSWYNDPEAFELRRALADKHGVRSDQISVGSGIDDLLGLVVRLFVEPGTVVVTSLGSYPTFNYHVHGFGGQLHAVPYKCDRADLQALFAAVVRFEAPLVYLANPDNPMGTWHEAEALRDFVEALPDRSMLILDEAYVEFAGEEHFLPLDPEDKRLLRMRTFSKAHGMAGARIGYAVGHREIIGAFEKVRNHFGVNRIAQAGALASLQDEAFVASVVAEVVTGRREYEQLAVELELVTVPSATNFVAFDVGERARAVMDALLAAGVFVRMPSVAPLNRCVRVTVGSASERQEFAQIFRRILPAVLGSGAG